MKRVEIDIYEFLRIPEYDRKSYIESKLKEGDINPDEFVLSMCDEISMKYIYIQE